jgi:hypothetical protein
MNDMISLYRISWSVLSPRSDDCETKLVWMVYTIFFSFVFLLHSSWLGCALM